jgi:L-xylulokinase
MGLYLGIDIGGTVTKAGVYDESGNELYIAEQNSDVIKLQPGFTERNMDELWQTTTALIRQCVAARGNDISGISFSSHGKGLYAVNKHGLPVRNGIISSDTRCESMVKSWEESGLLNKTYDRGLQQLWTGHPVALLAWLKEYERDNYDAIDSILMVHDYVRFMMTGELSAEITNISGSNLYNPIKGDYDPSLMADFNLAECEDKTAPIINSAQLSGKVTAQCAELTGLKVGTPVFGGLFDVVAAGITSCISDPSVISAVAGTWTIPPWSVTKLAVTTTPISGATTVYLENISCMRALQHLPLI